MTPTPSRWPRGRAPRAGLALGLVLACGACRRAEPTPAAECERACAALVESGCDREGTRPADRASCVRRCSAADATTSGCALERSAYLACVARQKLDCSAACSASLCLERGEGLGGCAAEHEAWQRCSAPCAHAGLVTTLDRDAGGARIQAELVRAGCAACPPPARGAPAGAACQAASVCGQVCCRCPESRAGYLARVCADGACADGERACALARASGMDPCPR